MTILSKWSEKNFGKLWKRHNLVDSWGLLFESVFVVRLPTTNFRLLKNIKYLLLQLIKDFWKIFNTYSYNQFWTFFILFFYFGHFLSNLFNALEWSPLRRMFLGFKEKKKKSNFRKHETFVAEKLVAKRHFQLWQLHHIDTNGLFFENLIEHIVRMCMY